MAVGIFLGFVFSALILGSAVQNGLEKIAEAIRIFSYQSNLKEAQK